MVMNVVKEKACGNCKQLNLCAYARAILDTNIKLRWTGGDSPFSWYEIAKICKFYELDEKAI